MINDQPISVTPGVAAAIALAGELVKQMAHGAAPEELAATLCDIAGAEPALLVARYVAAAPEATTLPEGLALARFTVAVRRCAFGPNHLSVAAALQELGVACLAWGTPFEAVAVLEEAYAIAEANADAAASAIIEANLGRAQLMAGEPARAAESLTAACAHFATDPTIAPGFWFFALSLLATAEAEAGHPRQAREATVRWVNIARHANQPEALALARIALARLDWAAGDVAAFARLRAEFGATLTALDPAALTKPVMLAWTRLLMAAGEARAALTAYRLGNRHDEEDLPDLERLDVAGEYLLSYGPAPAARVIFAGLLETCEATFGAGHPEAAVLQTRLAAAEFAAGEAEAALARLRAARERQEIGLGRSHPAVAATLELTGRVAAETGAYAEASIAFERALMIRQQAGTPVLAAAALIGLAALASDCGDDAGAVRLQRAARDRLRDAHGTAHPDTVAAQAGLGRILARAGDLADARIELGMALSARRLAFAPSAGATSAALAETLCDWGALLILAGDHEPAICAFAEATALAERAHSPTHPDVARARLGHAAALLAQGRQETAAAQAGEAFAILAGHARPELDWRALALLADIAHSRGDRETAILLGKLATNVLAGLRAALEPLGQGLQAGYIQGRTEPVRTLADRLVAAGRLPEAELALRLLKWAELRAALRGGRGSARGVGLSPAEAEAGAVLGALRAELARVVAAEAAVGGGLPALPEHQAELVPLGEERARLAARLAAWLARPLAQAEAPDPRAATGRGRSGEIGALPLPAEGQARIDYVVAPDRLHILLALPGGRSAQSVEVDAATLAQRVFRLWRALRDRAPGVRAPAEALYRDLIAPVAPALAAAAVRTLSITADGPLRYVAFAALHDGADWLGGSYAIAMRAASVAAPPPAGPRARAGSALFGTVRGGAELASLPFVARELAAIAATVGGRPVLDDGFTAAALSGALAERPSVVHLASHFVFRPADELGSWLLLGDGTRLTVADLLGGGYPVEGAALVALSACETALSSGRREAGRELDALPAALLSAGAGAVLATLWPAEDGSTAELLARFYRHWHAEALPPAEALRAAARAVMEGGGAAGGSRGLLADDDSEELAAPIGQTDRPHAWAHPHHWAHVVLTVPGGA